METTAAYPLELATHEQHPCPNTPLGALLPRDTIEMAFAVAQQYLREATEATMLFLVNLRTHEHEKNWGERRAH